MVASLHNALACDVPLLSRFDSQDFLKLGGGLFADPRSATRWPGLHAPAEFTLSVELTPSAPHAKITAKSLPIAIVSHGQSFYFAVDRPSAGFEIKNRGSAGSGALCK